MHRGAWRAIAIGFKELGTTEHTCMHCLLTDHITKIILADTLSF